MDSRQTALVALQGFMLMALSAIVCASPKTPYDHFQLGWQEYQAGEYDSALGYWGAAGKAG